MMFDLLHEGCISFEEENKLKDISEDVQKKKPRTKTKKTTVKKPKIKPNKSKDTEIQDIEKEVDGPKEIIDLLKKIKSESEGSFEELGGS